MCGIAGYVGTVDVPAAVILEALRHRGPDASGIWRCHPIPGCPLVLMHTRLKILDLTEKAAQPMGLDRDLRVQPGTPDGGSRFVAVYNGEIYNFRVLRQELIRLGHWFESSGDTEVIVRGYSEWGAGLFARLDGMFAIAVYDRDLCRLVLGRDHLGMKPLYYARTRDGGLGFASETRALLKMGNVEASLDEAGIVDYLETGSVRDPATLYRHVRSLPSGHYAVVDLADGQPAPLVLHRYWSPEEVAGREPMPEPEWRALHRQRLVESVGQHLASDVPVGIFLSGGIDSTLLLELAAKEGEAGRLNAFTLGGEATERDELAVARQTARRCGVNHQAVLLSTAELAAWVHDALTGFDLPSADGLNLALVSRAARAQGLKVALGGTGADELHGDYGHPPRLSRLIRMFSASDGSRNALGSALVSALQFGGRRMSAGRIASLMDHLDSAEETLLEKRRYFVPGEILPLYPPGEQWVRSDRRRRLVFDREALRALGLREQIRVADVAGYLKNTLLRDGDAVTMACGLEMRMPFLGRRYVECVLAAPERYTAGAANPKPRLVEMLSRESRALARLPKAGFAINHARLLRGSLRPTFMEAMEALRSRAGFEVDGDDLLTSLASRDDQRRARRLWALLSLGVWLRRNA